MAQMTSEDMGPAAFMWPKDRVWSAAADNTAPCGSIAGAGNRTLFPMHPKSNGDFTTLIDAKAMRELDKGHTCVPIADPPSSVKAGANATLQIKYISEFDKPENETFYACADITYVALSDFKDTIPCFNVTQPPDGDKGSKSSPTASPTPSSGSPSGSGGGSSGLSGGAIAGIVVGVVAGVGLLGAAALFMYRRSQQQKRMMRQQNSSRAVKWDEQPRDSNSQRSVRMQNMQR
ncbi:GPI anchored protein [Purpureocillium lilacinum]|nr:GPI anchored protein [Purpureocillium lilacinum]GJN75604.1 hypothetical protein PLICBS_009709 [Purpureocillium lilacinum]